MRVTVRSQSFRQQRARKRYDHAGQDGHGHPRHLPRLRLSQVRGRPVCLLPPGTGHARPLRLHVDSCSIPASIQSGRRGVGRRVGIRRRGRRRSATDRIAAAGICFQVVIYLLGRSQLRVVTSLSAQQTTPISSARHQPPRVAGRDRVCCCGNLTTTPRQALMFAVRQHGSDNPGVGHDSRDSRGDRRRRCRRVLSADSGSRAGSDVPRQPGPVRHRRPRHDLRRPTHCALHQHGTVHLRPG